MISLTLKQLYDKRIKAVGPSIATANIVGIGDKSNRYKVKLRSGAVVNNVPGPADMRVGQSITTARHGGGGRYSVLVESYASSDGILEVWV